MGTIIHTAVIVTTRDYSKPQYQGDGGPLIPFPDVEVFRASMPEGLRHLLVGPVSGVANCFISYVWVTSGSKEGFPLTNQVDEWRQCFIELWSWRDEDGGSPYDVLEINYGGDQAADGVGAAVREPYAWYTKED